CRPAQGQRLKHEGKARMPAQTQANQTSRAAKPNHGCQRKGKKTKQRAQPPREGKKNQTARASA
ncbi:hypothetical protein, partial [Paraburkholderia terrae]|uniref:hypothetical protein n=1 Tax=Paraburkholderia terrae TaxID=311230 RepID=UPI001C3F2A85